MLHVGVGQCYITEEDMIVDSKNGERVDLMKKYVNGEVIFSLSILIFLVILIVTAVDLPLRTKRLPLLIAFITLALTLLEIGLSVRKAHQRDEPKKTINMVELKQVGICVVFMAATVLLWRLIGYIATSIFVTIVFSFYLGAKSRIKVVATAIMLSFALHYVFYSFLRVPLPRGTIMRLFS